MNRKALKFKAPALVCGAVYLVITGITMVDLLAADTRNFLLLPLVSSVLGAALFLIFGALVREDTPPVVWVMVGLGNMVIAAAPCLLLTLLLRLPLEAWKDCLPTMLLSLYPFAAALWSKAVRRRESH